MSITRFAPARQPYRVCDNDSRQDSPPRLPVSSHLTVPHMDGRELNPAGTAYPALGEAFRASLAGGG